MPGIAGIISSSPSLTSKESITAMVGSMVHETFYSSGTHLDGTLGVCLGWTSFKGTFGGPVWNEQKDIGVIFSGEDLSPPEDLQGIDGKSREMPEREAACIVHLYEKFGLDGLQKLNGWFSGVLLDLRSKKLVLFNDRYGINRVYWHQDRDAFYFASEAKALLKILPKLRRLDPAGLGEFFSCGCVLQNRTFFPEIFLLPGGSAWTFSPGQPVRKQGYFDRSDWENLPELGPEEYYAQLKSTWNRILPQYFKGKEAIGLSLTGGLDSRMILACAPCAPGTLPCYTFGGVYRDCADVTISRLVAKACRQPHETIPLGGEYFREFPALVQRSVYLTDGTLDASGSADLFVQSRAREIGPVRVTGLNGGELLRRLIMFKPGSPIGALLSPEFAGHVQAAATTYNSEAQGHRLSFIAFKQAPWHLYSRLSLERTQLTIRTPYFNNDLVRLAYQAPPECLNAEPALRLIAEGTPALKAVGTDRARLLNAVPGLTYAHHLVQEFTFKAEYAYDYGMPQWLAKADHLFAPFHLERLFLGRHKFYHFRVWFRDQFGKFLKETLLDESARSRPYLNGAFMEKMVTQHVRGTANYTSEIQKVLTAELLQRTLLRN